MCNHHNIILDVYGTSTCADCHTYFEKSFCTDYTTNYNGPTVNILKTKSTIVMTLEKDFGVCDRDTTLITEKIFNLTSKNKMVKGTNKRSILCASLYYACHYLKKPINFEDMLIKFNINHKIGSKGLKLCQIAIQEYQENMVNDDLKIHSFASTHKEKLQELILRYNISLKNYDEIEKIIVTSHLKKNKILNNRINRLWISCIFFWLLKINPYIDPEEFISINSDHTTSVTQLKADLNYLTKNL